MKRLISALTALALTASMFSMTAFAAKTPVEEIAIQFNSTLQLSGDAVTAPNVTYTYTLENGEDESDAVVAQGTGTTKVDVAGLTVPADTTATAEFTVADLADSDAQVVKTVTMPFLNLTDLGITKAGFYVCTLACTSCSASTDANYADNYETDDSTLYVYLQVNNVYATEGATETSLSIEDSLVSTQKLSAADDDKASGYLNYYGVQDTDKDNDKDKDDQGLNFKVTAYSFGNLAESAKKFDYTVETEAAAGTVYKVNNNDEEMMLMVNGGALYETTYAEETGYTVEGSTPYTFKLAESDTFTITSVAAGDEIKVTMADPEADGYNAQYRDNSKVNDRWLPADDAQSLPYVPATYIMAKYVAEDGNETQSRDFAAVKGDDIGEPDDEDIDYDEFALPDTGVVLEFAPFVLMVLAAGAFISLRAVSAAKQRK